MLRIAKSTLHRVRDTREMCSRPILFIRQTHRKPAGRTVDSSCRVPFPKILLFPLTPNHIYDPRRPTPQRGVSRSSRTRGAEDAAALGARWNRRADSTGL